jgi:hypothetical protein
MEFPNSAAPALSRLKRGAVVYEVRQLDQWVEIRSAKERLGWVQMVSLRLLSGETATPGSGISAVLSAATLQRSS